MIWKNEAIEKLKQYDAKRGALDSIPKEIRGLELDMQSIRGAAVDRTPVRGSGSRHEDAMLSNIVKREELERSLEQARLWVGVVDNAMSVLTEDEKLVLERLFIYPEKHAAEMLADELFCEVKTIYRWKDKALRKFTIALYGAVES